MEIETTRVVIVSCCMSCWELIFKDCSRSDVETAIRNGHQCMAYVWESRNYSRPRRFSINKKSHTGSRKKIVFLSFRLRDCLRVWMNRWSALQQFLTPHFLGMPRFWRVQVSFIYGCALLRSGLGTCISDIIFLKNPKIEIGILKMAVWFVLKLASAPIISIWDLLSWLSFLLLHFDDIV